MYRAKKFMNGVKEFISYFIEAILNIIFCMFIFIGVVISVIIYYKLYIFFI